MSDTRSKSLTPAARAKASSDMSCQYVSALNAEKEKTMNTQGVRKNALIFLV